MDIRPDGTLVVSKDDIENIKAIENCSHLIYVSESYMNIKFALKPTEEINELERKVSILKRERRKRRIYC